MTEKDYMTISARLKDCGLDLNVERLRVMVPDAENVLRNMMMRRIGERFAWLPEYDEVARWMSDNKGKCLLLAGNVGRGKTEIGRNILPVVIHYYYGINVNCYDALDLSARKSEFINGSFPLCIDDLGTEKDAKNREVFERLADQMEKRGRFLIVTTNLSDEDIRRTYGDRVFDRLKGNTTCIVFKGDSMRG